MSTTTDDTTAPAADHVSRAKIEAVADAIDVGAETLTASVRNAPAIRARVAAAPETNLTRLRRLVIADAQGERHAVDRHIPEVLPDDRPRGPVEGDEPVAREVMRDGHGEAGDVREHGIEGRQRGKGDGEVDAQPDGADADKLDEAEQWRHRQAVGDAHDSAPPYTPATC